MNTIRAGDNAEQARQFVDGCGGAERAIRVVVCLGRALWRVQSHPRLSTTVLVSHMARNATALREVELKAVVLRQLDGVRHGADASSQRDVDALFALLKKTGHIEELHDGQGVTNGTLRVWPVVYHPSSLSVTLFGGQLEPSLIKYLLRKEKRFHFRMPLSPYAVRAFNVCAKALNSRILGPLDSERGYWDAGTDDTSRPSKVSARDVRNLSARQRRWSYGDIRSELEASLSRDLAANTLYSDLGEDQERAKIVRSTVALFIEACLMVGALTVSRIPTSTGALEVRTETFDAEYLIGHLYGMPTSIKGLDELFGGGGVILAESVPQAPMEQSGGRVLVIRGRSGLGKSLLSMQLALEVAKKGGVAWVSPLEQSPLDCLYALEATFHRDLQDVDLLIGIEGASRLEETRRRGRGALVLAARLKASVGDFLDSIQRTINDLAPFSLKLVVIDPINSVHLAAEDEQQLRDTFVKSLAVAKEAKANVLLVGEEDEAHSSGRLEFIEKVCDTSIRLSMEGGVLYSPKFLEIRKSRLQREQRGHHPFSILPGVGYRILPSTAAISAKIRNRRAHASEDGNRFGLPGLDALLGPTALKGGDVIMLAGEDGCLRRSLGLAFLFGRECPGRSIRSGRPEVPLLVGFGRDAAGMKGLLSEDHIEDLSRGPGSKDPAVVRVVGFSPGYISAGYVFQVLEEKINDMRLAGLDLDRVMVDGLPLLEGMFPLLAEDGAFAGTLVEFLRKQRVTQLYIGGTPHAMSRHSCEYVVCGTADVLIELKRVVSDVDHVEGHIVRAHGARYKKVGFSVKLVRGHGVMVSAATGGAM